MNKRNIRHLFDCILRQGSPTPRFVGRQVATDILHHCMDEHGARVIPTKGLMASLLRGTTVYWIPSKPYLGSIAISPMYGGKYWRIHRQGA